MLKHLYKNTDGSLKTMRLSLTIFLAVLAVAWALYGTNKAKDDLLVRVAQVLTPEAPAAEPAITQAIAESAEAEPAVVEKQVPELSSEPATSEDRIKEEQSLPLPAAEPQKTASQLPEPQEPALQEPAKEVSQPQAPETEASAEQALAERSREPVPPENSPDVSEPVNEALKQFNLRYNDQSDTIELASKDYADMYTHWRKSGAKLPTDKALVPLRIQNLANVFQLFQMKVVAVKDDVPFLDLMDRSRVAPEALSGYSSTCFVVNRPWEKWGNALADAGFSRSDRIEVRYYTYGFVRNAIYARAMKAFDWSLTSQNLPATTSPAEADVLGRVYAVQQAGGGAFGVFVPVRVDFRSGASVAVDPLACFAKDPDVLALSQAGLL